MSFFVHKLQEGQRQTSIIKKNENWLNFKKLNISLNESYTLFLFYNRVHMSPWEEPGYEATGMCMSYNICALSED